METLCTYYHCGVVPLPRVVYLWFKNLSFHINSNRPVTSFIQLTITEHSGHYRPIYNARLPQAVSEDTNLHSVQKLQILP